MNNIKNGFAILSAILIVIVVAIVGVGAYVYITKVPLPKAAVIDNEKQTQQEAIEKSNPQDAQKEGNYALSQAQLALDETADWKTYRNENMVFEFKYPGSLGDLVIEEDKDFFKTTGKVLTSKKAIPLGFSILSKDYTSVYTPRSNRKVS